MESDSIWCSYARAIQSWPDNDDLATIKPVYYIATAAHKGPANGSFVPDTYLNRSLRLICNARISNTSAQYKPGFSNSYIQSLSDYMKVVKLEGKTDPHLDELRKRANADARDASREHQMRQQNAVDRWGRDPDLGGPPGRSMQDWARENDPGLMVADMERQMRAKQAAMINAKAGGPGTSVLTDLQSRLEKAMHAGQLAPGLNMIAPNVDLDPQVYRKYYEALMGGTLDSLPRIPDEDFLIHVPEWKIDPKLKSTMDDWARDPPNHDSRDSNLTWSANTDKLERSAWHKLGHEKDVGKFGQTWLQTGNTDRYPWHDLFNGDQSGSVEIQLSAQRAALFKVTAGEWNIPRFRTRFPNTTEEVEESAKTAMCPSHILCASRIKIRLRATGARETVLDQAMKDVKDGKDGGTRGIKILGFTVGAGTGEWGEEAPTHQTDFVKSEDGWWEFQPAVVAGGCLVLAAVCDLNENP